MYDTYGSGKNKILQLTEEKVGVIVHNNSSRFIRTSTDGPHEVTIKN